MFYIFKGPNLVIIVLTSNPSFSTLQHSSLLFFQSIFFAFLTSNRRSIGKLILSNERKYMETTT